jgi:hypothetical protein
MQSVIIAMFSPPDSPEAALLVRRADGQFAFGRVDARVAAAARVAANWYRNDAAADGYPWAPALAGLEAI